MGAHLGPKRFESGDRSLQQSCAELNFGATGLCLRRFGSFLRKLWPFDRFGGRREDTWERIWAPRSPNLETGHSIKVAQNEILERLGFV